MHFIQKLIRTVSFFTVSISIFAVLILLTGVQQTLSPQSALAAATTVHTFSADSVANEAGSELVIGSRQSWLGNGKTTPSLLGLRFTGTPIPPNVEVERAVLSLTSSKKQWIPVSLSITAEENRAPEVFTQQNPPSARNVASISIQAADNTQWLKNTRYSYDVTELITSLPELEKRAAITLIIEGTGNPWARKLIATSLSTDRKPILEITYKDAPSVTPAPSPQPSISPQPTPTIAPTPPTPTPTPQMIFGTVDPDILGTCTAEVHDKYVTTGPDGVRYRTWHPLVDPSGCIFAHDHGDDPNLSKVDTTPPTFGYIGKQIGMDEPHQGFKVHVINPGDKNDEGTTALHAARMVFHMTTGAPKRFSARFHSMEYKVLANNGDKLFVQGLADVGQVGTICSNPRNQRTVLGLGCRVDSPYEIWENKLSIINNGTVLATAVASTAVFDPITVMDPTDLTKTLYAWDAAAQSQIFNFTQDRSYFRSCERETYFGPSIWSNSTGTTTFYTDVYGNVAADGVLKQEISRSQTNFGNGLGFVYAYKSNDAGQPMTQFKMRNSYCHEGLGVKN